MQLSIVDNKNNKQTQQQQQKKIVIRFNYIYILAFGFFNEPIDWLFLWSFKVIQTTC